MRLAFVLGPREAPNCTCMQSSRMTEFAIFWLPLFDRVRSSGWPVLSFWSGYERDRRGCSPSYP